ncbi:MAG TPA: HAD family hydrolase [Vicinamibacterales bacterium]|nr:HAD family hydrolase [Vicinamibacterales bacterium]
MDGDSHTRTLTPPKGFLFDYGGTLVEEVSVDPRAGNEWLLSRASYRPASIALDDVLARVARVSRDVASLRDDTHIETPWTSLTRLIHDAVGIRFDAPMAELELGFWRATVRTEPMPGARAALEQFQRAGMPMGVVSNTGFSEQVIRFELGKHGLTDHLAFVMVSSDYAVRKPNVLLYEVAAARLGVEPADIWFVGDRLDTDVAGAKAAGMTAVWFNIGARRETSHHPDLTVADWSALLHHVLGAQPLS